MDVKGLTYNGHTRADVLFRALHPHHLRALQTLLQCGADTGDPAMVELHESLQASWVRDALIIANLKGLCDDILNHPDAQPAEAENVP